LATRISIEEQASLMKFQKKMDKIQYNTYPIYNEKIPDMSMVKGICQCYYTKKSTPKKFLANNNMDLREVPEELKELTKIKEMLIT